ncbi:GntR family transcriptional regulator [Ochrobactrum pseudogrignonense]|nr:GntR family transcriptional regulator [Brucella pseudogrignonensis]
MSETIGASRSIIREALKLLENDGIVTAIQGKGRFLSAVGGLRVERPVTEYESVTEMLENLGYRVTNLVLDISEAEASEVEARALGLAPSSNLTSCKASLRR